MIAGDGVPDLAAPMTTIFMIAPPFKADGCSMNRTEQQDFQTTLDLPWMLVQSRPRSQPSDVAARCQPERERADDLAGDLVLHGEDVGKLAVVTVRPDVRAGRGVDQLGRDAHPIVDLAHAAFDHVAHAELATHLGDADRTALVDEG